MKAFELIVVTPPQTILVNFEQLWKALEPIEVTEDGNEIDVILLHPLNALFPILEIPSIM